MRQMLDFARTSQFDVSPWTTQRNRLFFSPVFQWCFNVNLPCTIFFFSNVLSQFSTRGWPRTLDVTKPQERRVASPPTRFNSKHEVILRLTIYIFKTSSTFKSMINCTIIKHFVYEI